MQSLDVSLNKDLIVANLTNLVELNIAFNDLSGDIPEFGKATLLSFLQQNGNKLEGKFPRSLGNCKMLNVLDLGSNGLYDTFPSWLGKLPAMMVLMLHDNRGNGFYGQIKISGDGNAFPMLHILDQTFLAVLNLSYNELEGSILQSNQFSTYSNDSYKGNQELCGLPSTKQCDEVGPRTMPLEEDVISSCLDDFPDWKIVLLGYRCGLVIGFGLGNTVLNEKTNKWIDTVKQKWNRNGRDQDDPMRISLKNHLISILDGLSL
ncbi:hypothetical protein V6N12_027968 [Hibiscus sabdariffa]|uniref:Uncharacterized protein n=1 Tax=Hibiscus sabdariffa TaxID=183260 RepID=A0ABR2F4F9_9ROSI